MSNFQTRFDNASTEARRLVGANAPEIRQTITKFYSSDFERLVRSISKLLELVDKGKVDHPEYLSHSSGNIAEHVVQLMEGTPASFEAGVQHFLQTTLPTLAASETTLARAVGNYYLSTREIKQNQIREIQKLATESLDFRNQALASKGKIDELIEPMKTQSAELDTLLQTSNANAKKITEIRDLVTNLASGDGRGKSLEALKRQAESKLQLIEETLKKASDSQKLATDLEIYLNELKGTFDETIEQIDEIETKANLVLDLSSQAGLATSYLNESKNLEKKGYVYSAILYSTSVMAAVIAAFYVLPALQHSVSPGSEISLAQTVPLALLRSTVLAPLVYMIFFTSRQISVIETIRMDYAEKAAASLAYSGYKGEMSEDNSLLDRLRGSLLLKFAEHPERLLRKHPSTEKIEVSGPGFRASSMSDSVGAKNAAAEEAVDQ